MVSLTLWPSQPNWPAPTLASVQGKAEMLCQLVPSSCQNNPTLFFFCFKSMHSHFPKWNIESIFYPLCTRTLSESCRSTVSHIHKQTHIATQTTSTFSYCSLQMLKLRWGDWVHSTQCSICGPLWIENVPTLVSNSFCIQFQLKIQIPAHEFFSINCRCNVGKNVVNYIHVLTVFKINLSVKCH